ncbi:MAG: DUF503 domain-containing protein [Chloroflexota bacterium]
MPTIGLLIIHLHLPSCISLKQKRGCLKPLLSRLHKEFNISVAEIGLNDHWQETLIACALVCNDCSFASQSLQKVHIFIQEQFPHLQVVDHRIECF